MDQAEIPCVLKTNVRDLRINRYLRSLEEYDKKAIFTYLQEEKYTSPLKKFFERDWNTHLSPAASVYSCQVHALLVQMQEMQSAGKIPAVLRPKAWNETHKNRIRLKTNINRGEWLYNESKSQKQQRFKVG